MQQQVRQTVKERGGAPELRVQHEREGQQRPVKVAGSAGQGKYVMPERFKDIPGVAQKIQTAQDQGVVVQVMAEAEVQGSRIEQAARQRYAGRQFPGQIIFFRLVHKVHRLPGILSALRHGGSEKAPGRGSLVLPDPGLQKFGGLFRIKFESTSRNILRQLYKYRFLAVRAAVWGSYPRDVVAGVATKRGPALLLAARKWVRRLRHSALRRRSAPKVGCILIVHLLARPAGRTAVSLCSTPDPPSASVQRRKLFPAPINLRCRTPFICFPGAKSGADDFPWG